MKFAARYLLPVACLLAGCASNPDQSIYIMPALPSATEAAPGSLALQLRPVILPDYLDTTDLVTRSGTYKINASRTGRWGERLSKGVTRTLEADLGRRLHAYVAAAGPTAPDAVQIAATVDAFDVTAAASVLAASWTIIQPGGNRPPLTRHGTFTAVVAQPGGDAEVVAAMAQSVGELSNSMAVTISAEIKEGKVFFFEKKNQKTFVCCSKPETYVASQP